MKYMYISLAMQTTDTAVIPTDFFQLKINKMVIEMKMETVPIISFSIDAKDVFYIIVSICKFIFTLINLMAVISDLNMWLWQWQWCLQVRVLRHFESWDPLH